MWNVARTPEEIATFWNAELGIGSALHAVGPATGAVAPSCPVPNGRYPGAAAHARFSIVDTENALGLIDSSAASIAYHRSRA